MEADVIVRCDGEFFRRFEALGAMLEAGNRPALYRFLREEFGFLFRACQRGWRQAAGEWEPAAMDEAARRELLRPLSHRQYRMIEQAFLATDDGDVLAALWEFLYDEERLFRRKALSPAEVAGASLILEQAYCRLARGERGESDC